MQNFWLKQLNAIKKDSFRINVEKSLIKQLRDSIKILFRKELYFHLNTIKAFRFIKIWAQNL
jgi:hypothetical protein